MLKLLITTLLLSFSSPALALEMTTYNIGMAHTYVPHAKERLPHIIKALREHKTDVLCLQEAWLKKDRVKIFKALKKTYPYWHFNKVVQQKSKRRPTCKVGELFGKEKFVSCMQKECKGLDGDEFTDCILDKCGNSLNHLKKTNRECAASLMAQVGRSTLMGLLAVVSPFKRAGLFAYGGSDGLMLFSKKPLANKSQIDFSDISTLNRRVALLAEVENKKILCTHLTPDHGRSVPYAGVMKDWKAEHLAQTKRLISMTEKSPQAVFLMGDFNCGPELVDLGIQGELAANCRLFNQRGYQNPLVEKDPSCTYCESNTLVEEGASDGIIDHIWIKRAKAERVSRDFMETVSLEEVGESHLSDHFGVKIRVKSLK